MRRAVQVYLGDAPRRIGAIRYDQQGARESAAFEYDAEWLAAPDRFTIDPDVDNEVAIRSYTAVGFRPVGVMRRYSRRPNGTWVDGLLMDLLADELL